MVASCCEAWKTVQAQIPGWGKNASNTTILVEEASGRTYGNTPRANLCIKLNRHRPTLLLETHKNAVISLEIIFS